MTTRRDMLTAGGALALTALSGGIGVSAAEPGPESRPATPAKPSRRLRTITYNVLACMGYRDKDDPPLRELRRPDIPREQMTTRFALELSLYRPDIVSFQESPGEQVVADIARRMGLNHHCFFHSGIAWPGAIMSRFRILESTNCPLKSFDKRPERLFTRHWGRAVLQADDGPLVVYSAHLFPGGGSQSRREPEVTEMLEVMADDIETGRPMLLQGDFNHKPDGPEYARWRKVGLVDAFGVQGVGQPHSIPSSDPQARIDYVWAHGPLVNHLKECRILYEGAFRTNPDDPGSMALSDHLPVMATFEW